MCLDDEKAQTPPSDRNLLPQYYWYPAQSQLLYVFGLVSGERARYIIMPVSLLGRKRLIALNANSRDSLDAEGRGVAVKSRISLSDHSGIFPPFRAVPGHES